MGFPLSQCQIKKTSPIRAMCLLLLLTLSLTGCKQAESLNAAPLPPTEIDMAAVSMELRTALGLNEELFPVEEEVFRYLYQVPGECYTQVVLLLSTGAVADEICLVKAKDSKSRQIIREKMTDRIRTQKESFADYLPLEAGKLDNALITEAGDYLILTVCQDTAMATAAIQQAMTNPKDQAAGN